MAYSVSVAPSAAKDIRALDDPVRRRVAKAIDSLATDPRPSGAKRLQSNEEIYRIRVGDYRVLYQIVARQLIVLVIRVRHRKDVHR